MKHSPTALLMLLMLFPVSAYPASVAGTMIPDQVTLDGGTHTLQLNGAGVRKKFFFSIYIGALYLPQPEDDPQELLASPPPNRVLMQFLYSKVDKQKMDETWREGFARGSSGDGAAGLADRLQRFIGMFDDMYEGDTVWPDYDPRLGTTVSVNAALLGVWLDAEPVSGALKNAMVGVDKG